MLNANVYFKDVDKLTEDEYILIRKKTLGASDVSALFGVGFHSLEDVLKEKNIPYITEDERKIGQLPNVRKGKDLEPLIRQKVEQALGIELEKPTDMYEIMPGLTLNFDALYGNIPYELKYVTQFGVKYWNFSDPGKIVSVPLNVIKAAFERNLPIDEHVKSISALYGIPDYYYTQIQTQIHATGTAYGFICALSEKDWNLYIFRIEKDAKFAYALRKRVKEVFPQLPISSEKETLPEPSEVDYHF